MINFFRKIRRKFADNNQFFKYSRYAIGEIVLVVIGILIALSINNWNEDRKNNKQLRIALSSVYNELVTDTLVINDALIRANEELSHHFSLKKRSFGETATIDTIIKIARYEFRLFWVFHIKYSNNTFDNLKSTGSFELLPESIKSNLLNFYNTQKYWVNTVDKINLQYQSRYEEFSRYYAVKYPRGSPPNSLIREISWHNIDAGHFAPRFEALMATKEIAWDMYKQELEIMQKESRILIKELIPYTKNELN